MEVTNTPLHGLTIRPSKSSIANTSGLQTKPHFGADSLRKSGFGQSAVKSSMNPLSKLVSKMMLGAATALPLAVPAVALTMIPTSAEAAVTVESAKLVKTLQNSKDEELIAAAMVQLAAANERDAIPHIQKILNEAKMSQDTLAAGLKALGQFGATGSATDKRNFSRIIQPYLFKVVVSDKDKNPQFMTPSEADDELELHPEYKIKDMRPAAARALGQIADPVIMGQMLRASKDMNLDTTKRMIALETLQYAPADRNLDKELITYLEGQKIDPANELTSKMVNVLLRHQAPEALPHVEKLLNYTKPEEPTPAAAPKASDPGKKGTNSAVDTKGFSLMFGGGDTGPMPTKTQAAILDTLLTQKKSESAPIIMKQMATFPDYFKGATPFVVTADYFRDMPATVKDELVKLTNISNAEKLVKETMPKRTSPTADQEKADNAKIQTQSKALQKLALTLAPATYYQKAGSTYQDIFSDATQSRSLRSLAIAGSAMLKDKTAVTKLMDVATDNTDDVDVRFDALNAVMEIFTPPLSKTILTDSSQVRSLQQYSAVFSDRPQFTQSYYKSVLFSEIRDARKLLIRANAPASALDEATKKIVDKTIRAIGTDQSKWKELSSSAEFKDFRAKMIDYVSNQKHADGFLRIQMIKALGETQSDDIRTTLKDLIRDPLARTQIQDMQTSNDMLMFPGYTKMEVSNSTRLAAIQALGRLGGIEDAEILERGLKSDDRRTHFFAINALKDLGKSTADKTDEKIVAKRAEISDRLMKQMPGVNLEKSERLNSFFKKLYAEAVDQMGGGEKLIKMMDDTKDTVLRRAIANGLINNDHYLDNPKVSQFLLVNAMGLADLQKKGIDGRGTEIAIIDGDYINDDVEGMKDKVVYPEWGRLRDADLRRSFHDEAVASVMVGRRANVTYGIAPGVDKIHSYAAWDDAVNPQKGTPLEERDGLLRSVDDIIAKRISGKSKVSVVNMSLGSSSALLYGDETTVKEYLNKLSARFKAGSEAGITFVISAGNERGEEARHYLVGTLNALGFGMDNGKLAQSKGVILVAATDTRGTSDKTQHKLSWFTSMGDPFNATSPDIAAPGSNIPLISRGADGKLSVDEMDGTSFSSPITAGVLLLMNQVNGTPLETEVHREILKSTAYNIPDVPDFMKGQPGGLDALKALDAVRQRRNKTETSDLMGRIREYFSNRGEILPAAPPPSGKRD